MILILLVIILAGFAAYRYWIADTGPKHFHAWLGEPMLDLVAQWPERLDPRLRKPPRQWRNSDPVILADRNIGFTIDMPNTPIEIPNTLFVWVDTEGGKVTAVRTTLGDHRLNEQEALSTAGWALDQLQQRHWEAPVPIEEIKQKLAQWIPEQPTQKIVGAGDATRKLLWEFQKPNAPSASLEIQYSELRHGFLIDFDFYYSYDSLWTKRLDQAVKHTGFHDSMVFEPLQDPEAFFAAVDRELAKEKH